MNFRSGVLAAALALGACVDSDVKEPFPITGTVTISNPTASEGTTADIQVTLSVPALNDAVIDVAVVPGGTAEIGGDFALPESRSVVVAAGATSATLPVSVLADEVFDPNEQAILSFAIGSTVIGSSRLTILDTDAAPTVSFESASAVVSEAATTVRPVIVLSAAGERDVRVELAASGTADVDADLHLPESGLSVTIPAGAREAEYPIGVVHDSIKEGGESLRLQIASVSNAQVSVDAATFDLVLLGDYGINDTGVVTFTDGTSSDLEANPSADAPQDADAGRDVGRSPNGFSLTKLDIDGNPLPADATFWGCVRDEVTGLVWEVKAPYRDTTSANNGYSFRSAAYRYTWYDSDPEDAGGYLGAQNKDEGLEDEDDPHGAFCGYVPEKPARTPASYCNTEDFVKEANSYAFCGRSDWRLPSIEQLRSLVDYAEGAEALPFEWFPTILNEEAFFSSTTPAAFPASALCLNTYTRRVEQCQKNIHYSVMLVSERSQ